MFMQKNSKKKSQDPQIERLVMSTAKFTRKIKKRNLYKDVNLSLHIKEKLFSLTFCFLLLLFRGKDVEFFAENNKNSYEKKYFTINKAADFVRSRARKLKRRPLLKGRFFDTSSTPSTNNNTEHHKKRQKNISENDLSTDPYDNNGNSLAMESGNPDEPITSTPIRQSRYLWKNARKRMSYVVSFIRRKDDDQVFLMEEDDDCDFKTAIPQVARRHSCSSIYGNTKTTRDVNSNTAMSLMYLSPKGRKLEFESKQSSARNSRRNSLDSISAVGGPPPVNDAFIFQKYLLQSQLNHSISSMNKLNDDRSSRLHHEKCFISANDFERDGNLQCLRNSLYESVEEDIGQRVFSVSDEDFNEVVEREVQSYINDYDENRRQQKSRDSRKSKMVDTRGDMVMESSPLSNIKHSSTYSYSVNDLYDLFNKDSKFGTLEVSFDDLVV